MAESRDAAELLDVWRGWHAIAPPMRKDYRAYVELANKGARELGFADTGAMWRSKYDMPPDAFSEGARPALGAGPAALPFAARLRSQPPAREVRGRRAGQRPHSRAPSGQHVGADLGEHLSAGRAERRRSGLRPDGDPEGAQDRRPCRWSGTASASSRRSASTRCRRPSGSARSSRSRATATWSATRAPGTSTTSTTCASRCASSSRPRTSSPSTTSWATTSTSAPTTSSPSSSATAPTTASTRPSATRSRSR